MVFPKPKLVPQERKCTYCACVKSERERMVIRGIWWAIKQKAGAFVGKLRKTEG